MYQNIFVTNRTQTEPSMVYVWDDEHGLMEAPYSKFNYAYVPNDAGDFKSIYGHRVAKSKRWKNSDLAFESDVPRETRVLTDLYLDSDEISTGHVIGIFDIEVSSIGGFPDVELADKEITSIAFYNQSKNEHIVFILDKDGKLSNRQSNEVEIARFDTERELLAEFIDWYNHQGFTILTGWNVTFFDIPYLYRRMGVVLGQHDANMLSPVGMVKWINSKNPQSRCYKLAGVSVLDYLDMYKKFTYTTRPNYRLDTIGQLEVDIGKVEYEGTLDDLFENDIETFIEYNLNDVKIVSALDDKMKLIDLVRGICHVGHVPYEDYGKSSKFIEGTILTYLHRKGIVCPNKSANQNFDDEVRFKGAYVKSPDAGRYDWVYSLDLQSLYPSIIMGLNISPETKRGNVEDWNVYDHISGKTEEYNVSLSGKYVTLDRSAFMDLLETKQLNVSSNGILYDSIKTGIIPEILDKWFEERIEYKNLMKKYTNEGNKELSSYYDKRQHIQKIFLNSIYGVLGLPSFRFYDLDNALAVTATGQDVIKSSSKFVNKVYNRLRNDKEDHCIYTDTDSIYFSIMPIATYVKDQLNKSWENDDDMYLDLCITGARDIEERLNQFYKVMSKKMFNVHPDKHRFHMKGENVVKTGLWVAKKRYAMLKVYDLETDEPIDNKLKVTGLDVVRSSFPPVFSKFMSETLMDILNKISKEELDEKILKFRSELKDVHYLQIARNTSVKDIEKYDDKQETSLIKYKKGTPAHVKSAIAYNRLLQSQKLDKDYELIKSGDKIKYVYLKKNIHGIEVIAVKGYDDPPEVIEFVEKYLDRGKLFDRELKGKLDDFYNALEWGNISTDVNQNATNFFSFN